MKLCSKSLKVFALTITLIVGGFTMACGQLTGVKLIAATGGDYASISAAITALNSSGVGTGGVTFNIPAGYTETISATLSITATGTSANPIIFQKSGTGANPLITSYTGTLQSSSTTSVDGMWRLVGSDYITIDGINLVDNAANTTATTTMEYGYALYKASATNGCQNVVIKNCTITLNRNNFVAPSSASTSAPGSIGILVSSSLFNTVNTVTAPTNATGANSNNDFYTNTIQNCNTGIAIMGYAAPSPFTLADQGNDIGGGSSGTGNSILNYGGGTSASTQASAITTLAQYGLNVSNNTINNNNGSGVNHPNTLRGVFLGAATSASSTVALNNINIKGGGTTQVVAAIENGSGITPASNTVNLSNNTIAGAYSTATSGAFYGIYNNAATPATLTIINNTITGLSTSATTGALYGIYNTGSPTTFNLTNNAISSLTSAGAIAGIYTSTGSGNISLNNLYTITSSSTSAITTAITIAGGTTLSVFRNKIYDIDNSSATTTAGAVSGILVSAGTTVNIYNNLIGDLKIPAGNGTDIIRGINITSATATSNINVYYNTIYLNAISSATNFGTTGIYHTTSTTATTAALNLRNNLIQNSSIAKGTGRTAAYRRSSTTLTNYGSTSNNNLFYGGTASTTQLIFYDGTNSDQALSTYKSRVSTRDAASITEDESAKFSSITGSVASFLHINASVTTAINGAAAVISGYTDDFDGQARSGTAPDIGADEMLQVSGTKLIAASGGDYTSISSAIATLNASGLGTGGVTFNVGPASATQYTETITAPLSLTISGSSGSPIIFQQNPASTAANPLITAYTGGTGTPATAVQDGIWRLVGTDYVTIDGIDLTDNPANTTNPATMEYGYALYRGSAIDGCQNVTIKNCTITLNRNNSDAGTGPASTGSTGILSANSLVTTATTAITPTSAAGANSNNNFYTNIIQNCNTGIALIGFADVSPFTFADQNNNIGGSSSATGNSILNYGGGASAATFAAGVSTIAQYGLLCSYNTINNNNGSGINHLSDLRGILLGAAISSNSTITYNNISVQGASTTGDVVGIENNAGATPASNTININNNTITGSCLNGTTGGYAGVFNNAGAPAILNINNNSVTGVTMTGTGGAYGILNFGSPSTLNANGNTIANNTIITAAGAYNGIYNGGGVSTAININNNNLGTATLPSVSFTTNANTSTNALIINATGTATTSLSISNNNFYTPNFAIAGSGSFYVIQNGASTLSQAINSNVFNNFLVNTTGDLFLITNSVTLPANGVQNINSNSISGTLNKSGAGGNLYLYNGGAVTSGSTAVINHNSNNFSGITVNGGANIQGWAYADAGTSLNYTAQNNTFANWTGGTGFVNGFNISITGTNSITANQINNITAAGTITGITTGSGNNNIFLNTLNTLNGTSTNPCLGISVTGGTVQNVYKNKLYDINISIAGGTVNAIQVSAGTTVNIYNNLIGDLKMPAGSGADPIRAINISSTTATSNINVYYNTIYLSAISSATNFGSTGIYHLTNATATTAALTLRNNIIENNSTPKGTGLTVAYRRSDATLTNYASVSNNNLFYGGTPSASQLIYYDGTNSDQVLSTYKTRVSTRDAASLTEDESSNFLSTAGSSASFLHINNIASTIVKGAAVNISGITDDFDGQIRAGNTGYTGGGTNPDIGADEIYYSNEWLGVTSTDWNTASNWQTGVPTLSMDVDIPSGKTYYPNLVSGTYAIHNISIRSGASVTLTGGTLQINGGTLTAGSFNVTAAGGTVEYNGTNAQTIPASTFTTNTIANLKTNNSSGVTLAGALNLTGILYPTLGAFNTNGNLTLISSAAQTALIDGTGSGSLPSNITMQRYMASGFGYKFFSSPMQAATVASFSSTAAIPKLAADSIDNFYNYTEADTTSGFHPYTTLTNTLAPLVGYAVNFGSATSAKTVAITGIVNNIPISLPIFNTNKTFTQGFNLMGNPYPSPIDWDNAAWTKTNVDNTIYYYDTGSTNRYLGTYSSYKTAGAVSSDGIASNIVASMQGFFVHVSNGTFPVSGTLGVTNAVRINSLTAYFHKSNSIGKNSVARSLIRLSAAYNGDAKSADPLVIYTDNGATKTYSSVLDAVKLLNTNTNVPNFYIRRSDNIKLVINAVEGLDTTTVIPLSLKLPKDGAVDFSLLATENLPGNLTPYFYDARIGKHIALKNGNGYTTKLSAGTYDNRFYLTFNNTDDIAPDADNFYVYRKDGKVYANIRYVNNQPGDLSLIGITGNIISRQNINGNGIYDLGSPKVLGVYIIRFISQGRIHAKKIFVPE